VTASVDGLAKLPEGAEPGAAGELGYRGKVVCTIVGITYRQLDYWARTGLIRPSIADAQGSGSQRLYSYRDLVSLKVIKNLLDAGVSLQKARRAIDYLRENLGEELSSANLVLQGTDSVIARSGEDLFDLVRQGQGVLNIVPLGPVVDELDQRIHEIQPASERAAVPTARPMPKAAAVGEG